MIVFKTLNFNSVLIFCVFMVLSACTNNDEGENSQNENKSISFNFAVPQSLTGPLIPNLEAKVTIDGGAPITLTVNTDNTISKTIPNVAVGIHTLVITYFVTITGDEVDLATYSTRVSVSKNQTSTVTIADGDLNRDIDTDIDGFTNLAEVRIGTNALDKIDKPDGDMPQFALNNGSSDESSSTGYGVNAVSGEPVSGTSTSTNFQLRSGFSGF